MKLLVKYFFILLFLSIVSSCVKEGHVCYRFEIYNSTDTQMTINLSSWGKYSMYINGMYSSDYKFHKTENIQPYSSLIFSGDVGDDPDPHVIPTSLTPAWEYILSIECDGIEIPKEYFSNPDNWELNVGHQINGTFTHIGLLISPELIEQFRKNKINCKRLIKESTAWHSNIIN